MAVEDTIFNGLTKEDENATTEVLANLLRGTKCVREIIFKWMFSDLPCSSCNTSCLKKVIDYIQPYDISTQVHLDGCIPDLVIENSKCFILIENKIGVNTPLQEPQEKYYVQVVRDKQVKVYFTCLFFLTPKKYAHSSEISKIKSDNSDVCIIEKNWEYLFDYINGKEICRQSPLVNEQFEYLKSVIIPSMIDIKLNQQEVNMLDKNPQSIKCSINIIQKLFLKIRNAEAEILTRLNECTEDKTLFSAGDYVSHNLCKEKEEIKEWGKYLNYKYENGDHSIFIGLCFQLLENNQCEDKFVFCVAISDKFVKNENDDGCKIDGWYYFKLATQCLEEDDNEKFINEVCVIINTYFDKKIK